MFWLGLCHSLLQELQGFIVCRGCLGPVTCGRGCFLLGSALHETVLCHGLVHAEGRKYAGHATAERLRCCNAYSAVPVSRLTSAGR